MFNAGSMISGRQVRTDVHEWTFSLWQNDILGEQVVLYEVAG